MDAAAAIQQEATEIMVFDASVTARHCSGSDTCQGGQSEPHACQSFMEPKPSTKASEDGISMTRIYIEIASYDLQLLGVCSGRFSSPRREYTTCSNQMIEH
jgi:hypothetical protein